MLTRALHHAAVPSDALHLPLVIRAIVGAILALGHINTLYHAHRSAALW